MPRQIGTPAALLKEFPGRERIPIRGEWRKTNWRMKVMKKISVLIIIFAGMLILPTLASAQGTGGGSLAVTATIVPTITLVLDTDGAGVTLTGTGTNAASLGFGSVSAYAALSLNVGRTVNGVTNYTISTPFDVKVTQANSPSLTYTLAAELNAVDGTNTWTIGGVTITGSAPANVTATGVYGGDVAYSLVLTIPFGETAGLVSNTINFAATPN
jgi:hypothetical protein